MISYEFIRSIEPKDLRELANAFYLENFKYRRDRTSRIKELDKWCRKHITLKKREISPDGKVVERAYSYEDVACALPAELKDLKEDMYLHGTALRDTDITEYVTKCLYEKMRDSAKAKLMGWLEGRNVLTCPHCNHNYILYDARSKPKLNTGQLDHYYPKSKYPILAASFFNLIPACSTCNLAKSDKSLAFYPYKAIPHNRIMNFRYELLGVGEKHKTKLELKGVTKNFEDDIAQLRLDALYQKHLPRADELARKYEIYSDEYFQRMGKEFSLDPEYLKRLTFAAELEPESFLARPLSKFTYDVLKCVREWLK